MAKHEMTARQRFWLGPLVIGLVVICLFNALDRDTAQPLNVPDVQFSLSEEQRFQAWAEVQDAFPVNVETFKRMKGLADGEYWPADLSTEELDALDEQTSRRVEAKYGLTIEQLDNIFIEAYQKNWLLKRHEMRGS